MKISARPGAIVTLVLFLFSTAIVPAQSGPRTAPEIVARAAAAGAVIPPGKFQPTRDSLKTNHSVPAMKPCDYVYSFKITGLKLK